MAFGGQSRQRWGDNTIQAGEYLRDIQVTDLSGRVNHTGPLRSKGGLLLVFFDGGAASKLALPYLQKIADACKESGKLSALGVCAGDESLARTLTGEAGVGFPVALDHGGYLAMSYGLGTFPTLYLAGPNGAIQHKLRGWNRAKLDALAVDASRLCGIEPFELFAEGDTAPARLVG
jgi:hypothetical protein